MENAKRYCLALDLKDDPELIEAYKAYHRKVWPEVLDAIHNSGIREMEIYILRNRLFMIMETEAGFSFDKKSAMDKDNPKVRKWEALMWKYQQAIPGTKPGEKWVLMDRIFRL